ncbi:MAG: surface-binding protein, partial [Betaproteobacteria bacterium]|nr:surface-binding protein [Betaproteobacteria bacterium]
MADFAPAYEAMIRNEGGYVLHDVPGDRGGQTYAGIARNMNPRWPGWALIDRGQDVPAQLVR